MDVKYVTKSVRGNIAETVELTKLKTEAELNK